MRVAACYSAAVALLCISAANPAQAYERWVRIHNLGESSIWSVQVSNIDRETWGRDLLYDNTIPAGYHEYVEPLSPEGYCRFDVRIVYESNLAVYLWDVNLCELKDILAHESGYTEISY